MPRLYFPFNLLTFSLYHTSTLHVLTACVAQTSSRVTLSFAILGRVQNRRSRSPPLRSDITAYPRKYKCKHYLFHSDICDFVAGETRLVLPPASPDPSQGG